MKANVRRFTLVAIAAGVALAHTTAWAHTGTPNGMGFGAGFAHPWSGVDHLLAMLAVGLWAAQQGGRKVWVLPLLFVTGMVAGAGLAWMGIALPWVEGALAASVVVLGCLIAFLTRMPLALSGTLVALMAVFHGHAHGTEAVTGGQVATFALGFALATLALHALGIGIGWGLSRVSASGRSLRLAYGLGGAAIAGVGVALLVVL